MQRQSYLAFAPTARRRRRIHGLAALRGGGGGVVKIVTNLKEESEFRNERDVVPAGIRTGPNPQI